MSRVLVLLVGCAVVAQLGCGDPLPAPGSGGGGDGGGGSGAGGDPGTGGTDRFCIPDCARGASCLEGACVDDYSLNFMQCPAVSGPKLSILLEVRPAPGLGLPSLRPGEMSVQATFRQNLATLNAVPYPGQDNVFELDLDLEDRSSAPNDGNPLSIQAHALRAPQKFVECNVLVDNLAPRITPEPLPATGFRRDSPVVLEVAADDRNMGNGPVMAYLAGPDDAAPAPPDVAPAGWVTGVRSAVNDRFWTFTLDQTAVPLPAFSATLVPYVWATDRFDNAAVVKLESPYLVDVTRQSWTKASRLPAPVRSGLKAGASGASVTNVPAIDGAGIAILTPGARDNFSLLDPQTGTSLQTTLALSGDALAPVIGADGSVFVVSADQLRLYQEAAGELVRSNTCATGNHSILTSPPVLVSPAGQPFATTSRGDATLSAVLEDRSSCSPERASSNLLEVGLTPPAATVDSSDRIIEVVGGRRPSTLTAFTVGADGSFTLLNAYAPEGFDALADVPLALDGDTVLAAPRFRRQASAFSFSGGFDVAPTEKTFVFEGVDTDSVGPPIVSQHAVVFPTAQGLRALPRGAPWAQAAVLAPDQAFVAPALAGRGDILYAVNRTGLLYVVKYRETPAPVLEVQWSVQVGDPFETFSVSPVLTCDGLLVLASESGQAHALIVDSKGLDPLAPWPKVLHDSRNTGNAATSLDCEP